MKINLTPQSLIDSKSRWAQIRGYPLRQNGRMLEYNRHGQWRGLVALWRELPSEETPEQTDVGSDESGFTSPTPTLTYGQQGNISFDEILRQFNEFNEAANREGGTT